MLTSLKTGLERTRHFLKTAAWFHVHPSLGGTGRVSHLMSNVVCLCRKRTGRKLLEPKITFFHSAIL